MDIERRFTPMQVRMDKEGDSVKIRGYAAVFDKLSGNLGGFREVIAPGAFDGVLQDDVRGLFNHDANFVLGRTKSGTLKLSIDSEGLQYEIEPSDSQTVRDLVLTPMERGDIDQSSFAFTIEDDDWSEDEDGRVIRTIKKVRQLFDVSPVTFPAYPDASVGLRGLDEYKKQKELNAKPAKGLHSEKTRLIELGA